MTKRILLQCSLSILMVLPLPAMAGKMLDQIRSEKKLVIAHLNSVPFAFVHQGKPVGYAIEICQKLADAVRRNLGLDKVAIDYVQTTTSERFDVIRSGKAHFECGSTTNNQQRREWVAFTIPHFITGARLLVRHADSVERLQDLRGKRVVSTDNSTPLNAVTKYDQEHALRLKISTVPDFVKGMEAVDQGEADAFVMDDVLLYGLIASHRKDQKLKVTGRFVTTEPLAIMLSKDDPELKAIVDAEMRRLISTQEIHALYKKWFQMPIPPNGTSLNMPMNYLLKDFWKFPSDVVPF